MEIVISFNKQNIIATSNIPIKLTLFSIWYPFVDGLILVINVYQRRPAYTHVRNCFLFSCPDVLTCPDRNTHLLTHSLTHFYWMIWQLWMHVVVILRVGFSYWRYVVRQCRLEPSSTVAQTHTHTHTHTNAQFSLYNFTIVAILREGCFRCLVSTRWMNWGCWLQHFQHFRCLGNHQLGAGSCLFISTTVDYLLTDLMRWTYFNYLLLFVYVLFFIFFLIRFLCNLFSRLRGWLMIMAKNSAKTNNVLINWRSI